MDFLIIFVFFFFVQVHAPVYEIEGMVHAPKKSPKCNFTSKLSDCFIY